MQVRRPALGGRSFSAGHLRPLLADCLQGGGVSRTNDLIKTTKEWRQAAVLEYASSPLFCAPARGDVDGGARAWGEKVHRGNASLVGWSGAANDDQSAEGRCRLGYVIGMTSATLNVPCHTAQWTPKFSGKLVRGSLGGEVCAFSEMSGLLPLPREYYEPLAGASPGMISFEYCESLLARPKNRKAVAELFFVRRFLGIQQSLEDGVLDNAYWLPGLGNPADGLTGVKSGSVFGLVGSGGIVSGSPATVLRYRLQGRRRGVMVFPPLRRPSGFFSCSIYIRAGLFAANSFFLVRASSGDFPLHFLPVALLCKVAHDVAQLGQRIRADALGSLGASLVIQPRTSAYGPGYPLALFALPREHLGIRGFPVCNSPPACGLCRHKIPVRLLEMGSSLGSRLSTRPELEARQPHWQRQRGLPAYAPGGTVFHRT